MVKLYEVSAEHNATFLALLEMEDIDDQTFEDTMSAIEGEFKDKIKSTAAFMQNVKADVDAMKDAEKRIADRRKALENKVNRLKDYLRDNMEMTGTKKLEYPEFKVSLRAPLDIVCVSDESIIPDEYVKLTRSVNKNDLKSALKEGKEIPGAKLEKGKPSLTIK